MRQIHSSSRHPDILSYRSKGAGQNYKVSGMGLTGKRMILHCHQKPSKSWRLMASGKIIISLAREMISHMACFTAINRLLYDGAVRDNTVLSNHNKALKSADNLCVVRQCQWCLFMVFLPRNQVYIGSQLKRMRMVTFVSLWSLWKRRGPKLEPRWAADEVLWPPQCPITLKLCLTSTSVKSDTHSNT